MNDYITHKVVEMPEADTSDEKLIRKLLTAKWGWRAFISAIVAMVIIVLANAVLAPIFNAKINEKPSLLRRRTFKLAWSKFGLLLWTFSILVMSVIETHQDLTYLVKRLGRVSVALMPPMYLLTLRPSPLPRTFYLQVIPMHKWLSRIVVFLSFWHGVLYAYIYYEQGTFSKLKKPANIYGIIALFCFLMMAYTGWYWFRRRHYEPFYSFHVISAWACVFLVYAHSRPPATGYMAMCLFCLLFQVVFRIWCTGRVRLRVQYVSPTLLLVDIPKSQLPGRLWKWSPAAHVRISGLLTNPFTWIHSSHPYTIANLSDDPTLRLVVRPGDYKPKMRRDYSIFGPQRSIPTYLEKQIQRRMLRRVLFVTGGSGIAFAAPIMRYLQLYGIETHLIWAIRDPYDARVLPSLKLHENMLEGRIEVYFTGEPPESIPSSETEDSNLTISTSDFCDDCIATPTSRRVLRDDILRHYTPYMYNSRPHLNLRHKTWLYGYDNEDDDCCCADRLIDSCDEDQLGAWVFSAGGPQLVREARRWADQSGICFFEEPFSL